MKRFHSITGLAAVALFGLTSGAHAQVIDFDGISAQQSFDTTSPGGAAGPMLVYPDVTFTGGVVLDGLGFASENTSSPNLYATSDFHSLADASTLPGLITGTLAVPGKYDSIRLDIANGFAANLFTLSAYDASNTLVDSDTIFLNDWQLSGAVNQALVSGANISYFTVTTGQTSGSIDFAIDTVVLSSSAVPEPGTVVFAAILGLSSMGLLLRRRTRR